jgi:hypothetical protein
MRIIRAKRTANPALKFAPFGENGLGWNISNANLSEHTNLLTMNSIQLCELPQKALLCKYKQQGAYTDCYSVEVPRAISHSEYVEAFYTTTLFKAERFILAMLASRPSTDLRARQLALGEIETFAAWSVEGRAENQLLLCDFLGRTRSWLMTEIGEQSNPASTRLYFGSAVVPERNAKTGLANYGFAFHALLGFHRLYSRALLRSAVCRLAKLNNS